MTHKHTILGATLLAGLLSSGCTQQPGQFNASPSSASTSASTSAATSSLPTNSPTPSSSTTSLPDLSQIAADAPSLAGNSGSVSAADPRAQAAGEWVLARGGSASDAAIAVMLALTVVEPQSSGLGGGGFYVRGTRDGAVETIDGREMAPSGADPDWFLKADGSLPPFGQSVRSGLSVGVPGNFALAALAHKKYGRLPWATVFAPAIKLADQGFIANVRLEQSLNGKIDRAGLSAFGRALYYNDAGAPIPAGTRITNPKLASLLRAMAAQGREALYAGPHAAQLAQTVRAATPQKTGGETNPMNRGMSAEDVMAYEAKPREAVCGYYRDYRVCGMGPPSSGAVAILQILGQLERFDLRALGADNPVTWHLFSESQALAYADRELYLADGDFVSVPVNGLIAKDYLAQRSGLIRADTTMKNVTAGRPAGASAMLIDGDEGPEQGTSHFAVADAQGNMISYTSTIEGPFGSGLTYQGMFLNNELTDFSRSPQVDGRMVANRVEGGKRPRSSMAPSIVYAPDGRPLAVIGAAGGATIPVQTARSIIGIVDFDMDIEQALGMPFLMNYGGRLFYEKGSAFEGQVQALRALGHEQVLPSIRPLKSGGLLWDGSQWNSARDPRLNGKLEYSAPDAK